MNPHIFREYDIRGVAETDLTDAVAFDVARAFGSRLREAGAASCILGWDVRESSPRLKESFGSGLLATGLEVVRIGVVPTPVLYYAIHREKGGGGAMITGSHNPPDQNGFKLCLGTSSLHGDEIRALGTRIEKGDLLEGKGAIRDVEILPAYQEMVVSKCAPARPLRVVLDMGNGCGGITAPEIFRRLGHEVTCLYAEPDGRFPNHQPDPTVLSYMRDLCARVVSDSADLGVGYAAMPTGSASSTRRVSSFTATSSWRCLLATCSRDIRARRSSSTSSARRVWRRTYWRTGEGPSCRRPEHPLLKAKMREEGAILAGEMSGHIFFGEGFYGHDDGEFTASAFFEPICPARDNPSQGCGLRCLSM